MNLRTVFLGLEMEAGLALLEARHSRISPKTASGFVDRLVTRAREQVRAAYEKTHIILPFEP
ncbi:MAG: hypothetical protein V4662_13645 [Verrucomicrobiota bacterium]